MANPYHDADGKFCSRGEMETAIQNAASSNQLDTYFSLRKDLEDIDAARVKEGYNIDPEPKSVEELSNSIRDYGIYAFAESVYAPRRFSDTVELHGLGEFRRIADDDTGWEDNHEIWVVFEHQGKLYKLDNGYYSSLDGREWKDAKLHEVERHEKVVISFDPVD